MDDHHSPHSAHVLRRRRPAGSVWSRVLNQSFLVDLQAVARATTTYVTLEMYAALPSGGDLSKPGNIDLFDASGLAKFLATEIVIETGKDPVRTAREKGIDTIVKYQIRVRNNKTSSDVNVQAEFAKFARFDNGAVLPEEDADMFARSTAHSFVLCAGADVIHIASEQTFLL